VPERVGTAMDQQSGGPDDGERDDQDRVVSRRVENPTKAEPGDEVVYQAANPESDDSAASPDLGEENDSEPVRSE
jgi:hypothetical protein